MQWFRGSYPSKKQPHYKSPTNLIKAILNSRIARTSILYLIILCHGCAHYYANFDSNLLQRVKDWNEQSNYDKSIKTLMKVKPDHEQYEELQRLLVETQAKASEYELNTIQKAEVLVKENQWADAHDLYQQAQVNLGQSKSLTEAMERFYEQRQQYLDQLNKKLVIEEAKSLPQRAPLIQEIARVEPENEFSQRNATNVENQVAETSAKLKQWGETALEEKQYERAKMLLTLSRDLIPAPEIDVALQQIASHYKSQKQKKQHKKALQDKQIISQLIEKFETQFKNAEYLQAKETIKELAPFKSKDKKIASMEIKLKDAIDNQIKSSIDEGQRFYSQGQFEEAYKTWRRSLVLAPDNPDLIAHIDRVQRVLESIRRLNQSGQKLDFPSE